MRFMEKNLEDIIYENLQTKEGVKKLNECGLRVKKPVIVKRQLPIFESGTADIVTLHRQGRKLLITVYELKKEKINAETYEQACRYIDGAFCELYYGRGFEDFDIEIYTKIILIGKEMDVGNPRKHIMGRCLEVNADEIYKFNYDINGIRFINETTNFIRKKPEDTWVFQPLKKNVEGIENNREIKQ